MIPSKYTYPKGILGDQPVTLRLFLIVSDFLIIKTLYKYSTIIFLRCRLRKKNWKNVGRVYLDSQVWVDDVVVYSNGDVLIQELPESETVTSTSQLSVFVRHWQPSTLTLGPFEELILDTFGIDDLKQKVANGWLFIVEF